MASSQPLSTSTTSAASFTATPPPPKSQVLLLCAWRPLLVFLWLVPNAVLTVGFTDMVPSGPSGTSCGMELIALLTALHKKDKGLISWALVGFAACVILPVLYVMGWPTWAEELESKQDGVVTTRVSWRQIWTAAIPWAFFVVASILQAFAFPLVVRLMIWLHAPILVMLLKVWCTRNYIPLQNSPSFQLMLDLTVTLTYLGLTLFAAWWLSNHNSWDDFHARLTATDDANNKIYDRMYEFVHRRIFLHSSYCEDLSTLQDDHSPEDLKSINAACSTAETVFFALWATPFLYMAALAGRIVFHVAKCCLGAAEGDESILPCPLQVVKVMVCAITVCIGTLIIVPAAGSQISVVNGFAQAGVLVAALVFIWALWNFSRIRRELKELKEKKEAPAEGEDLQRMLMPNVQSLEDKFEKVKGVMANEWIQAMMMGSGIVPTFYVLESLRRWWAPQKQEAPAAEPAATGSPPTNTFLNSLPFVDTITRFFGNAQKEEEKAHVREEPAFQQVTDQFMTQLGAMDHPKGTEYQKWNICSVLVKVCLLGELYFTLQVGGTKATYVFLSYVQEQLKGYDFEYILLLAFVVGLIMFMLPFVPGVPVYIFCGMVVTTAWTERATGDPQTEFYKGCFISVGLGLCLKLMACCGQYLIGYSASRSIAVLKFVGADTKVTRAIAVAVGGGKNVSCFGKVLVLVGGPDWPTSVMCGILKVNLPSMLCHTIPVVTVMSPCVLAGAFLASVSCSGQGSAAANASIYSLLAAVGQLGSMLGAMIYLQMIYTKDFPAEPEPWEPIFRDYNQVVELRKQEKEKEEAYQQVLMDTKFFEGYCPMMGCVIGIAALLTVVSNGIFTTDLAFENFSVSSRIGDDIDKCGLGGDVWNIVKLPGKVALGLFVVSVALHIIFVQVKKREKPKSSAESAESTALLQPVKGSRR